MKLWYACGYPKHVNVFHKHEEESTLQKPSPRAYRTHCLGRLEQWMVFKSCGDFALLFGGDSVNRLGLVVCGGCWGGTGGLLSTRKSLLSRWA